MSTSYRTEHFTVTAYTGPANLGADRRRFEINYGEHYFFELTADQLQELKDTLVVVLHAEEMNRCKS